MNLVVQRSADLRRQFLILAVGFEGGLLLMAFVLGWLLSVDPLDHWVLDTRAIGWGLAGTAPLYLLFLAGYGRRRGRMQQIRDFLIEKLGPHLTACRLPELVGLGVLAGVAEEFLFRGVLQPWFENDWGWLGGVVISNLVFALAHWVTPLYGLLAGVTGAYLGLALDVSGERNLVIPTVIHSVYDFLAFAAVARSYRASVAAVNTR